MSFVCFVRYASVFDVFLVEDDATVAVALAAATAAVAAPALGNLYAIAKQKTAVWRKS